MRLHEAGARADLGVQLRVGPGYWVGQLATGISILSLAIDDETNDAPPVVEHHGGRQLKLPVWTSRELQRSVLEALIAAGADVDGCRPAGLDETRRPLRVAVLCANKTAVEVLLAHGAAVRGLDGLDELVCPPLNESWAASITSTNARLFVIQLSARYQEAFVTICSRLFDHDPALVNEACDGEGALHMACMASRAYPAAFILGYLELFLRYGGSLTGRNSGGQTPLDMAVSWGAPSAVAWLCERLDTAEINAARVSSSVVHQWCSLLGPSDVTSGRPYMMTALEEAAVGLAQQHKVKPVDGSKVGIRREIIRVLLQHGASVGCMRTDTPGQRQLRSLVLGIQREMGLQLCAPQEELAMSCPPSLSPSTPCLPPVIECPSSSALQHQQQQQQVSAQVKEATNTAQAMRKSARKALTREGQEAITVKVAKKASTAGGQVDTIGFEWELAGLQHTQWAAEPTGEALQAAMTAGRVLVDGVMASSVWKTCANRSECSFTGKESRLLGYLRGIPGAVDTERAARCDAAPHAPQADSPLPLTTAVRFILALFEDHGRGLRLRSTEEDFATRQLRVASQASCRIGGERVGLHLAPTMHSARPTCLLCGLAQCALRS
ncbi:unnamed protein product [Vitrella brassicaformis CCMP3155]|uniref:Uncharacterized protein n=1 Tax=Vitrella brassicaformis (strain CCMP3155) TaxID=1169540 RepID=A0A0G4F133_VITBC|nr:unnamed protein product [Vitrella brassicaformis CCMP3155]|eukprot:CEM05234.1 unnamed protein product [Vitrella brassicaformis CCMP3155]